MSYKLIQKAAIVYRQDLQNLLAKLTDTQDDKAKERLKKQLEHLRSQLEKKLKPWFTSMNIFFKASVPWDSTIMDHLSDKTVAIMPILSGCERMIRQNTSIPALRIGQAKLPEP